MCLCVVNATVEGFPRKTLLLAKICRLKMPAEVEQEQAEHRQCETAWLGGLAAAIGTSTVPSVVTSPSHLSSSGTNVTRATGQSCSGGCVGWELRFPEVTGNWVSHSRRCLQSEALSGR